MKTEVLCKSKAILLERLKSPPPTAKRAISTKVIQQMIDLPPLAGETAQMARDCFLLSFALIGMNSADLLACVPAKNNEIIYYRQKTASRRADNAEMHVLIEPVNRQQNVYRSRLISLYGLAKNSYI